MNLVITGKSQKLAFTRPIEAAPDTAVLMEDKNSGRKLVRILETEPDPRIESNEIAPDAELGPTLLGRKVGDEIEVPSIGVAPTVYVIREIRNKYLHAHYRSLEQFEGLFPGNQAFGSFSIDETKGEAKFKPIFDSAKRRSDFIADLAEKYRQQRLPLMMVARLSGHSPFDTWGMGRGAIRSGLARLHWLTGVGRGVQIADNQSKRCCRSHNLVRPCATWHSRQSPLMF